jgi:sugar O-acyltransferase (sialic acid O-acetyltransferase NeuD family)
VGGVPVLGPLDAVVDTPDARVVVAVASSLVRRTVVQRLVELGVAADRFCTVIDPTVRNPAGCPVGRGSIFFAGVTITADAVLGAHLVAMPGVTITHDCVVGDFVTFAAGVSLGGGCTIGEAAYLGMNCAVRQGVTISPDSTVGMGAVVLDDVPAGQTWVGVPARPLQEPPP